MKVLREAFRLIFGYEAPKDIPVDELVERVAEGLDVGKRRELAERCLREIEALEDKLPHEVYSYARRELYSQLYPQPSAA